MRWTTTNLPHGRVEYTGAGGGVLTFYHGSYAATRTPPRFYEASPIEHALAIQEAGEEGRPLHDDEEGLKGRRAEIVAQVLDDHALVALRFIEALHRGDNGFFRKMDNAIRQRKKEVEAWKVIHRVGKLAESGDLTGFESKEYKAACIALGNREGTKTDCEILLHSIGMAAKKWKAVPSVEQVAETYEGAKLTKFQGLQYSTDPAGKEMISATKLPKRDGKAKRLETMKKRLKELGFGWLPHRTRGDTLRKRIGKK